MSRPYDKERDFEHHCRIWKEIGWWIEGDRGKKASSLYCDTCDTIVEEVHGEMEVGASRCPAIFWHQKASLPAVLIVGVYAGRVGRQNGHALALTAESIALAVDEGACIASLGIFDQGFYDRIGFGIGSYIRRMTVDPNSLQVPSLERAPHRLGVDDYEEMHAARLNRRPVHGRVDIVPPGITGLDCLEADGGFGLGFRNADGVLTHHMWLDSNDKNEFGPYWVEWMVWNTRSEFMELLSVLRSLGDQVRGVRIPDPPEVQIQQLLSRPFRQAGRVQGSDYAVKNTSAAYQQHRICDLPRCVEAFSLPGPEVRFNLELEDPIQAYLPEHSNWKGCGGDWIITLGDTSSAVSGRDSNLPTMKTTVGAFTRLWLGVSAVSGLAITDSIDAPGELLGRLDQLIRLPRPLTDWDY